MFEVSVFIVIVLHVRSHIMTVYHNLLFQDQKSPKSRCNLQKQEIVEISLHKNIELQKMLGSICRHTCHI